MGRSFLSDTWWSALENRALEDGTRTAFQFEGPTWAVTLAYGDWFDAAGSVARSLAADGVGSGDTVGVLAPGSPLWPIVQAACSRLGAVLVPINNRYRQDELSHVLGMTRPRVIFHIEKIRDENVEERLLAASPADYSPTLVSVSSPALTDPAADGAGVPTAGSRITWHDYVERGRVEESRSPWPGVTVAPTDSVLMQFTSGTTAFPKGALLGSASTLQATYELGVRMGLDDQDVMYSTQPMYHVGGSVATTLMALTMGCVMVVPERYSPEETFRLVKKYRVTARTGQAAMYAMELAHPDFSPEIFATTTKGWCGGTAELKRAVIEQMGVVGLVSMYGLTEAAASTTVCAASDSLETRLDTSGHALPGLEVGILADGQMHERATPVGEVCVRGWSLMNGYFQDAEATRSAIDADGWLHTGDLGHLDQDGNLLVVDRIKDMIKPGGENVSPAEIERVIAGLDGVNQVAVVGRADAQLGEVPVAFVERAIGSLLTEEAVIEACRATMASFKVPRAVVFVASWPMTESGKIVKGQLRAQLADNELGWVGRTG